MSSFPADVLTLLGALTALAGPPGGAAAAPPAEPQGAAQRPVAARDVACTLSSAEKRERRAVLQRELVPRITSVTELEKGYVLWFDRSEGELARIASFVELESQCCAFLDFAIRVDSGSQSIALQLEGPPGTKELFQPLIEGLPAR